MTGVFSESALSHASANVRTTQLSNTVTREFPGRLFTIIAGSQTVLSHVWLSASSPFLCVGFPIVSGGSCSPGTRYSPSTHFPRSISWHRSEQKGRNGLPFHSTGLPQVGHLVIYRTRTAATRHTSEAGRLISIRLLTNSIVPSRRMAFKRTVTLSRVDPTIEAISRCGSGMSIKTPLGSETP